MDLKLRGKRALVTGSSRGIGRAIALSLGLVGALLPAVLLLPEAPDWGLWLWGVALVPSTLGLAAFETHAVDYLVKPVRRERLLEALENARRLTRAQASALQQAGPPGNARNRLCVRQQGNLELIPVDEIRYFQADQKYVVVRTCDSEILIDESLRELEEEFASGFVRIHRNALVAVAYLAALEKNSEGQWFARLRGSDKTLAVSRRHLSTVRKYLADGTINKNERR